MTPSIDLAERTKIIGANIQSGKDTYAGRLGAWHELGAVIGKFATYAEIEVAAKADFEVFKSQLRDGLNRPINAYGTFRWNRSDREAGNKEGAIFLGTVGKDYGVIQHSTGGNLLDGLVGAIGGAHYETMGVLDFGRVVWIQVDPDISIRVGNDVSDVLLTFVTSHDGSKMAEVYETIYRAVCRNTLRAGRLKKLAAILRIPHTKNANRRIASWGAELAEIQSEALTMQEKLNYLAKRRVTRGSLETIMSKLFPVKASESDKPAESSTRRDNVLAEILARFESNDSQAYPEQAGTPYALLNAITGWVDHDRSTRITDGDGSSARNRAESATFGTGDALKSRALDLILAESESLPSIAQSIPVTDWSEIGLTIPSEVR